MKKLYEDSYIQEIAEKIRNGLKIDDTMSIAEMPAYIERLGNPYINTTISLNPSHLDENGVWVRPSEYEDVGSLTWENNEEVCYLSLSKTNMPLWMLGLYITASKGSQIEYGHVINGEFVSIGEPELIKSNTAYIKYLPDDEDTLVAKITSQNYLYPITAFNYYQFTSAQANTAINVPAYIQPIVERVGNLPYITSTAGSGTSRTFSSMFVERDALKFGHFTSVTNLSNAWQYSYNLEELDVNDIDTSHWKVGAFSNAFSQCVKIKKIDLSNWDTTNWTVTSMANIFTSCCSLIELKIEGWNTENWKVNSLLNAFQYCHNLQKLEIENWNTSNWLVTTISNTFNYCTSLKSLDLSKWNTTNWPITTISNAFSYCVSLKNLDISTWDVSNWLVTTMSYIFDYDLSLITLDLSKWNVSNWPMTNISYAFDNCRSLKYLLISNWDTSNWQLNSMSYAFQYCISLTELPIENWNTSNWPLATMSSFCAFNWSLKRIDLSKWDTTNFNITDCRSCTSACRNLEYVNISTIQIKTIPTNSYCTFIASEANLKLTELYPQPGLNYNQSYSSMANLSKASLLRILNSLPQATTARTLTLGNLRAKLTVAELAIATEKGWTVA